jgi:hypothetical protein
MKAVGLGLVALLLASLVGVALWLRWKENRWLAAPPREDVLAFSFRIESESEGDFHAFGRLMVDVVPPDFPGIDFYVWPERGYVELLGQRDKLPDVETWARKIGSNLSAVARERAFLPRWKLAVIGREGVLWGPRESKDFP